MKTKGNEIGRPIENKLAIGFIPIFITNVSVIFSLNWVISLKVKVSSAKMILYRWYLKSFPQQYSLCLLPSHYLQEIYESNILQPER